MIGEAAHEALSPKHRAVVDLVSPLMSAEEAYRQVYKCSSSSARRAVSRLLSQNVQFRTAVDRRLESVTERALERSTLELADCLDRVAEMVLAPSGKKLDVKGGRVTAITPGQLRPWVDTALKAFAAGLAGEQREPGDDIKRTRLLPESLPQEQVDELFAAAREAGTLPGLIRPEDDDERVLVVEPDADADDSTVPVIQHPALTAVAGGGG